MRHFLCYRRKTVLYCYLRALGRSSYISSAIQKYFAVLRRLSGISFAIKERLCLTRTSVQCAGRQRFPPTIDQTPWQKETYIYGALHHTFPLPSKKDCVPRCPSDIFLGVKERLCLIATCTHRVVHHTFPLPSTKYCVLRRSSSIYFLCR